MGRLIKPGGLKENLRYGNIPNKIHYQKHISVAPPFFEYSALKFPIYPQDDRGLISISGTGS